MHNYRYLVDDVEQDIEVEHFDVVVIGSGLAGLFCALEINDDRKIAILTKDSIDISNSILAQGGIAASIDKDDTPNLHYEDTLYAGAGLCNSESVRILVNEAESSIEKLADLGVDFDKTNEDEYFLTKEGAHSMNRIIHVGDMTGLKVCETLYSNIEKSKNVVVKENSFAVELVLEDGRCRGVLAYDKFSSKYKFYASTTVVCASGGIGQIYKYTTNPEVSTGDGLGLAYRANAQLIDLEFIQFHPTVLYHKDNKNFLISEAVRGEGAVLKNADNEQFMAKYHDLADLAPRDVVSRAIFEEMKKTGAGHVYLDITFKSEEYLKERFPNIYSTCLEYGINISKDLIPVAPAAHYYMGGIKTDTYGRTNIEGFFSCGESACTGVHGANRLASNSLLEGLVFACRIASLINNSDKVVEQTKINWNNSNLRKKVDIDKKNIREQIQNIMTEYVGIERDAEGLEFAKQSINKIYDQIKYMKNETFEDLELQNMVVVSKLIIEAAIERTESRGGHFRTDYKDTDDNNWNRHIIKQLDMNNN